VWQPAVYAFDGSAQAKSLSDALDLEMQKLTQVVGIVAL
jgi:hypothetical protein